MKYFAARMWGFNLQLCSLLNFRLVITTWKVLHPDLQFTVLVLRSLWLKRILSETYRKFGRFSTPATRQNTLLQVSTHTIVPRSTVFPLLNPVQRMRCASIKRTRSSPRYAMILRTPSKLLCDLVPWSSSTTTEFCTRGQLSKGIDGCVDATCPETTSMQKPVLFCRKESENLFEKQQNKIFMIIRSSKITVVIEAAVIVQEKTESINGRIGGKWEKCDQTETKRKIHEHRDKYIYI